MERALLQGERQAELDQMEAETDIIAQLQHKLDELESAIQREKDKVGVAAPAVTVTIPVHSEVMHIISENTHTHTACAFPVSSLVSYIPCWFITGSAVLSLPGVLDLDSRLYFTV